MHHTGPTNRIIIKLNVTIERPDDGLRLNTQRLPVPCPSRRPGQPYGRQIPCGHVLPRLYTPDGGAKVGPKPSRHPRAVKKVDYRG